MNFCQIPGNSIMNIPQKLFQFSFIILLITILLSSCQLSESSLIPTPEQSTPQATNTSMAPLYTTSPYDTFTSTITSSRTSDASKITSTIMISPTSTISPLKEPINIVSRSQGWVAVYDGNLNLKGSFQDRYQYLSLSEDNQILLGINALFEIVELSFDGITLKATKALTTETDYTHINHFLVSPDRGWLAYLHASGELGMGLDDAEFRNVRLIKINSEKPSEPSQLTHFGSVRSSAFSWSPNSRYLVFSDRDAFHQINQIFAHDVKLNERVQLTRFGQEFSNLEVLMVKWSPDSRYLAFEVAEHKNDDKGNDWYENYNLGLIDLVTSEIVWIDIGRHDNYRVWSMHWYKDQPVLLMLIEADNAPKGALVKYNVEQKEVSQLEIMSEYPVYEAIPLDLSDRVLLVGGDFFLIYDEQSKNYYKTVNEFSTIRPEIIMSTNSP